MYSRGLSKGLFRSCAVLSVSCTVMRNSIIILYRYIYFLCFEDRMPSENIVDGIDTEYGYNNEGAIVDDRWIYIGRQC